MGASLNGGGDFGLRERFFDIVYDARLQSLPRLQRPFLIVEEVLEPTELQGAENADIRDNLSAGLLKQVQSRADIDISGPEFNFVRSIRVFDVRYARQHESGRDDDCNRSAIVVLGTYGIQGDFAWRRSSVAALPEAHTGLEQWGRNCPSVYHRSVFVEWRDYEGNYGYEQVNY
ncbi:MAG: hypothetical protein MK179_19675 [Pirellulaceae bacterium]|nr:hypothetical protein [Pirellulaceae bacterium]